MPNVSEVMTLDVQVVGPQESLRRAAQMMAQMNVGSLPVCNGRKLLGMVTDRDITVRGTAAGLKPESACVSDVMTPDVAWCTEDQDCARVLELMGDAQVRRLPVINADRELVGIVSIGDLATTQSVDVDEAMRDISTPSEPAGAARVV